MAMNGMVMAMAWVLVSIKKVVTTGVMTATTMLMMVMAINKVAATKLVTNRKPMMKMAELKAATMMKMVELKAAMMPNRVGLSVLVMMIMRCWSLRITMAKQENRGLSNLNFLCSAIYIVMHRAAMVSK